MVLNCIDSIGLCVFLLLHIRTEIFSVTLYNSTVTVSQKKTTKTVFNRFYLDCSNKLGKLQLSHVS